jgi:LmbE family N-acetylglucosaminyl deacetylase
MLVKEIRTFKPDAVLCGDPEVVVHGGGGINHTDHRAAAMAAVDAVYPAARNPMAFPWLAKERPAGPQGPAPVHDVVQPARRLDRRRAKTVDRKIEALRCHASQIHDPEAVFGRVRGRMSNRARGSASRRPRATGSSYSIRIPSRAPDLEGRRE